MFKTESGLLIEDDSLNKYELENGYLSYRHAWDRITGNASMILCNNMPEVDSGIWDNIQVGSLYDSEEDSYSEVYQWYIIDINDWDVDYLRDNDINDFIITYSDVLDCYILAVTHWGTSWDYVLTDIKIERC